MVWVLIPHRRRAAKNRSSKYGRFANDSPPSCISLYPQKAGKIFPIRISAFGRSVNGNIIPESMMEGKKTS